MGFRFEFDCANRILLARVEGRLSDALLAECYESIRKYSTSTDAKTGIFEFSAVSEFAISTESIRRLARLEPAMPDATERIRIIAVSDTHGFGLARMFQLTGEPTRPMLQVVHTLDEALAAIGVRSPHFEPLD